MSLDPHRLDEPMETLTAQVRVLTQSVDTLAASSRKIENLTRNLAYLTVLLVVATAALLSLELVKIFVSQGLVLWAQASIAFMILVGLIAAAMMWWITK